MTPTQSLDTFIRQYEHEIDCQRLRQRHEDHMSETSFADLMTLTEWQCWKAPIDEKKASAWVASLLAIPDNQARRWVQGHTSCELSESQIEQLRDAGFGLVEAGRD